MSAPATINRLFTNKIQSTPGPEQTLNRTDSMLNVL